MTQDELKIGEMYHIEDVVKVLKGLVEKFETQKEVARLLGVSEMYLCDILKYRRKPGVSILQPLGFEKVTRYIMFDRPFLKSQKTNRVR